MEERLAGASLLILANKQDLPGSLSVEEIKQVRNFRCWAVTDYLSIKELELDGYKTHHWSIYAVSAVTGQNLIEAMDWLVQDIASRIFVAS